MADETIGNVGSAYIELKADMTKLTQDLAELDRKVMNAATGAEVSFMKFGAAVSIAEKAVEIIINTMKQLPAIIEESTRLTARVETLGVVLNVVGRNAGYSNKEMQGYVDSVKAMGITTQEAQQGIVRMAQAQINLSESSKIARIAQDAAVIANINSSEAFQRLVLGIQRGETEILRTMGINVQFEQDYEKMAQKVGKTAGALTEQEKVQARVNAVMKQGQMINGAYAGAMDTVGKQALSLARYSEEAKLKFGELFQPTYKTIIEGMTEALKKVNAVLEDMKTSGQLDVWADRISTAFKMASELAIPAFLAGLSLVAAKVIAMIPDMQTLGILISKAMIAPSGGMIALGIAGAAYGGFKAGQALDEWANYNRPDRAKAREDSEWTKENKEFLADRWKHTQKQLEESGIKGMLSPKALADAMKAGDVVKYKVKVGESVDLETGKIAEVFETRWKNVKDELEKTKAMIDATTKGLMEMAKALGSVGEQSLKFAKTDLSDVINKDMTSVIEFTVEYQKMSEAMKQGFELDKQATKMQEVAAAFGVYGDQIEKVYGRQLELQRDILTEMKSYETHKDKIAKMEAEVTQTEMKALQAKLDNYRAYYDELKKQQKSLEDAMIKSVQKLAAIEKAGLQDRKDTNDLLYNMWDKANPAGNEMETWNRKADKIYNDIAYAATLSGQEQIDYFKKIQQAAGDLGGTLTQTDISRQLINIGQGFNVTTDFMNVTTSTIIDKTPEAMNLVQNLGQTILQLRENMAAEETANQAKIQAMLQQTNESIATMEAAIKAVQNQLNILDEALARQRVLSIDTSQALSGLRMLQDSFSAQGWGSKYAIDNSQANNGGGSSYVEYVDQSGVGYASGMNYVPKTGYYKLHEGEEVKSNSRNNKGGGSMVINGLTINVPEGSVSNPRQFARELAPMIDEEITRYKRMAGK